MKKKTKASGSYESEGAMAGSMLGGFFGFLIGGPVGAIIGASLGAPTGKALSQREAEAEMKNSSESEIADHLSNTWQKNRYKDENGIDISFGNSYCRRTYTYELTKEELENLKELDIRQETSQQYLHNEQKYGLTGFYKDEDYQKSIENIKKLI